ncbi:MAG TPA: MotA/TolQ/ExbB proton channel family protein [Bryobacteraceae bacterium]|nr:MotA/TolQ/ExbB proton channel family protein [Bryobacteraceae bacterium]
MLSGQDKTETLKAVKRASAHSAAVVHRDLKQGLHSLAAIASIAPWVGLFGTVLGIRNSFGAVNGSKELIMVAMFERLSGALALCAFGLIVALVAMWVYKYLLTEVETLSSDMENASLQLMNDLGRLGPH